MCRTISVSTPTQKKAPCLACFHYIKCLITNFGTHGYTRTGRECCGREGSRSTPKNSPGHQPKNHNSTKLSHLFYFERLLLRVGAEI